MNTVLEAIESSTATTVLIYRDVGEKNAWHFYHSDFLGECLWDTGVDGQLDPTSDLANAKVVHETTMDMEELNRTIFANVGLHAEDVYEDDDMPVLVMIVSSED